MVYYILYFSQSYAWIEPAAIAHFDKEKRPYYEKRCEKIEGPFDLNEAEARVNQKSRILISPHNAMDALVAWCDHHLTAYDIRIAALPASNVVRIWVQMDQNGKRHVPLCGPDGKKLIGEASLKTAVFTAALYQAAHDLLMRLTTWGDWYYRNREGDPTALEDYDQTMRWWNRLQDEKGAQQILL